MVKIKKVGIRMLYFAYGSNLNMFQMKRRCTDSVPVARVRLKNYKLVFNRVADIIESKGDIVEGAIYEVSRRDIKSLDVYEGYPKLYTKIEVIVEDMCGERYKAFVYVMVEKGIAPPIKQYFDVIATGYRDWGLPIQALIRARRIEE